ncbi:BspA family leucine-rich repeat surface protein [Prevotella copri]|uniref:BspA family leucine-rich repeat surface protein n=1 Tax=Segatella copri TaxID=165179 RepID=A0AAW4NFT0_9BACT|nr:BspA family leucine-rich repeat surface protein [Segatella copri]MBV3399949.1 BspA family leucine-rich repeat surface protein [Segatella copri]MBV3409538.1 BspA family leucine-rich repeat surface protein [Segatella copri]MBV3412501.1 BspA family leucine-rich repeat surface protein [Segatella copri]MBV3442200.1 BspA family leucine-rich repeat surface protein [Segatella copri]MBV3460598.1 BspA family leucine-rich repeat surface protein [Segatella copri]
MGGAKFYRFALFPLMLLMLLFVPTRMVAQTDYDTSVTFSALAGSPEGMSEAENFKKLFDGKKTEGTSSKWCCYFHGSANVIFKASKAGVPVGYTITTGNDNETWGGRNPKSWKLYGNNTDSNDAWELIDEVSEDKVLKDKNYASYEFTCKCSTSYQYFKWEISAVHGGDILQVGEFELKLQTCSHKNTDGSDALGEVIENVEPTCTEHGYTTHKCSLCNSIVKVYKHDVLKPHKLTHHELKDATCTEAGNIEYWQCSVCNKLFSDEATTKEITDATSLVIPAKGHTFDREGNCTVCHYKDSRYALFNLEGITDVTITDNDSYPWKMLDLNADGMSAVSSYFTAESKGLMSNNYGKGHSTSEIEVKFNVVKPILFSFKYLISAKNSNDVFITLNGKLLDEIKGTEQKVYKSILNKGEYTLKLSYNIFDLVGDGNKGADRAFIYDLNTATTISDYVAELDATNTKLTFKKITSNNLESIDLSRLVIVNDKPMVKDMYDIETKNIKNIVFDESFKTYAPTSLEHFFAGCSTLETISGLEYLNTANVTNMYRMFYECNKLSSLDLSNFNTANVTNMEEMFYSCQNLSSLDLSKFNTEKVTNMSGMFYGCQNLSSLDLSKFNTEKVTNMSGMFAGCQKLSSLDLSKFNTKEVKHMNSMFESCSALSSLDLSNFNTANVESMSGMFAGCQKLSSLTLSNFNTANVEFMDNMFNGCSVLTSLDLSNFNTKEVRYMYSMFQACSALTTIYASDEFVTTKVEIGSDMFSGCTKLKGFDSSMIDHKKANCGTDGYFTPGCAYAEFDNATGTLTFRYKGVKPAGAYDLNVESNNPGWEDQKGNIKKVVFDASFAIARPTSCCWWFANCFYLTEIEGIENLNTQNVTDMRDMFTCCYALTSLDVSNFNTQNVEDMTDMFLGCEKLSLLDLSNFNTERVESMSSMFSGCSTLQTIFASDKFFTNQVFDGYGMFQGCENLKGFIDYIPDSDRDNNEYANYKTGYFTKLVGKNGEKKIGATGETLATENLVLDDGKDFVAYEPFAAKDASYSRKIKEDSTWGTLCLPFAIDQSKETECKFYRLTGIDNENECITLESCEEGEIPAGTPVLFKMNKDEQTLSISTKDASIVKEPVAGTNVTKPEAETASDVNLVGSFTKIGGKDNKGLDKNDYIIGKDKFWRVSDLDDGNGVGIKPMRAYIHPAYEYLARAAMLSIGKGEGTTAIDNLNAISNDANAEYYDANGRRTNGLQKGLNIVKRGSKTYKIMVK